MHVLKFYKGLAALFVIPFLLNGCGYDLEVDAPVLKAVGLDFSTKAKKEPKLKGRAPLVIPPDVKRLPDPEKAEATATAQQNWPDDPDLKAKRLAKLKKEAKEKKAREIDYSDKSDIDEFEKITGQEPRGQGIFGEGLFGGIGRGEGEKTVGEVQ